MRRPRELSRAVSLFAAKTPTLPPATHTNSYALGARDVLLVEPATPHEAEQRAWIAWACGLVSQGRRPVALLATHHHPDHVGGLDVLARELDLPIWAHAETFARLDPSRTSREGGARGRRELRELRDGEALVLEGPIPETWTALHTPGHAWGHVCLWNEASRTMVVGDMVTSVGTILIAPGDGDMKIYLEQLERLARLDARVALPAHGDPIDDPSLLFRRYVAHRLQREAKVLAALSSPGTSGRSVIEVVAEAYADTPPHVWPLARLSVEMHLKKLVDEGRAVVTDDRYARAA